MSSLLRTLRGWSGYLYDLVSIARFRFSYPHSYTKFLLINTLRKKTGARIFIEAGTLFGVTAERCASVFDRVYTVELDRALVEKATASLADLKHVQVIQGDALEVLPQLLRNEARDDILLFLDGHFSGGTTACGEVPEPAVEILQALAEYRAKIRAIVIDDFRTFGAVDGFPTKAELLGSAEACFDRSEYEITVHLDNVIIARKSKGGSDAG
jgi:hypothetical protein